MYNLKNLFRKNKLVEVKDNKDGLLRFFKVVNGVLYDFIFMAESHIVITAVDARVEQDKQKMLVVFSGTVESKHDFLTIIKCIDSGLRNSFTE
jgi:hypothetical protein